MPEAALKGAVGASAGVPELGCNAKPHEAEPLELNSSDNLFRSQPRLCWRKGCGEAAAGACFTPVILPPLSCQDIAVLQAFGCRTLLHPSDIASCLASKSSVL